jgi:hypothetical protein
VGPVQAGKNLKLARPAGLGCMGLPLTLFTSSDFRKHECVQEQHASPRSGQAEQGTQGQARQGSQQAQMRVSPALQC